MNKGPNPKRMRGRGNGRGGRKHNPRQNVFDSNGPDVRIRGTAQQVLEKYLSLAREASANGDHISAEGYFQHAEHYFRVHQAMMDNADGGRNRRRQDGQEDSGGQHDRGNGSERDDDERYQHAGNANSNGNGRDHDDNDGDDDRDERRDNRGDNRRERDDQPRAARGRGRRGERRDEGGDSDATSDGVEALRPNGQHAFGEAAAQGKQSDRGGEASDESPGEKAAS